MIGLVCQIFLPCLCSISAVCIRGFHGKKPAGLSTGKSGEKDTLVEKLSMKGEKNRIRAAPDTRRRSINTVTAAKCYSAAASLPAAAAAAAAMRSSAALWFA